jgi:hypothetical protein
MSPQQINEWHIVENEGRTKDASEQNVVRGPC